MIRWYQHARAVQASIVDANMALVMAMARRTRIPHVDFPELVSEGNMALLRAIEKFDVSRGFKFSTYACRAILKGFNRMATKTGRYVQRFPTEFDPDLERSDYDVLKHRIQQDNAIDDLKEVLATNRAKLTDVEQTVVTERFALESGGKKKTLNEVGQQVGLTTERVRQIQKKALAKLKATLNEEYLAA
jgi:RNA polymerase sigma factor (sigma-70 family)